MRSGSGEAGERGRAHLCALSMSSRSAWCRCCRPSSSSLCWVRSSSSFRTWESRGPSHLCLLGEPPPTAPASLPSPAPPALPAGPGSAAAQPGAGWGRPEPPGAAVGIPCPGASSGPGALGAGAVGKADRCAGQEGMGCGWAQLPPSPAPAQGLGGSRSLRLSGQQCTPHRVVSGFRDKQPGPRRGSAVTKASVRPHVTRTWLLQAAPHPPCPGPRCQR